MSWTKDRLINFENRLAEIYNRGEIKHPVHFSNGNESELIKIFAKINKEDWIFNSWRSHYQCLLKGVDEEHLIEKIKDGKSIALCFPEFKIYASAIVGGTLPMALGVALSIKMNGANEHVWCFIGDMTSEIGMAQSAMRYAANHKLPITFVIEDNQISVTTETRLVWGSEQLNYEINPLPNQYAYVYKSKYPHAGAGVRVTF